MDRAYFEQIERVERKSAVRLVDILIDMFSPDNVVDLGCATGFYLKPFKDKQIQVKGYDNAEVAKEISSIPEDIEIVDLSIPQKIGKYDLSLCLEVGEHIDEQHSETFVDNVCASSNVILFSAAIGGQSGEGHINCQPKAYWIEKFERRGYRLDDGLTNELMRRLEEGTRMGWLTQNGMVFVNSDINKCHFILTSDELYYLYYLSIMSAIKTQKTNQFILWAFKEPTGNYWQFLKDKIELKIVKKPDFPALRNKPLPFQYAHLKDHVLWEILYSYGGLYLDLDNFCVADIFELWDDEKDLLTNLIFDGEVSPEYLYHSGCMIVKPKLEIMKQISLEATSLFLRDDITWGETGPPLFSRIVSENHSKVKAVERGVLGGNGKTVWNTDDIFSPGRLWDKAKLAHVYAGKRANILQEINEDFINSSPSLYAELVNRILDVNEWNPLEKNLEMPTTLVDYGIWHLGAQFRRLLYALVPDGSSVLELGSGIATEELAKHYKMISVEHDPAWLKDIDTTYIYAPLKDGWYDVDSVKRNIELLTYDALLIDGPVGNSRAGFDAYHHLFDLSGWIFVDDVHRQVDSDVFDKLTEKLVNRKAWKFYDRHGKAFGVIAPENCDDIGDIAQKLDIVCYYKKEWEPISDNIVHFVLTSNELTYPYYLSIMSALKTQRAERFVLWAFMEPEGKYWPLLKDRIELKLVNPPCIEAFSADTYLYKASASNCLEWSALYEFGGIYLDLDTFCISDITGLLQSSDKEMVLPNEVKDTDPSYPFFNSSIVMAHHNSDLMKQIKENTEMLLGKKDLVKGELAKQLMLVVRTFIDEIGTVEYGVLGGGGSDRIVDRLAQEDGTLWKQAKVLHLYANASSFWRKLSEDFIRNSNILFARMVREVLVQDEWNPSSAKMEEVNIMRYNQEETLWQEAQRLEKEFWSNPFNVENEKQKQAEYAIDMGLKFISGKGYDLHGKSVLDIGGGMESLLLKCFNYERVKVVDPMTMPAWVIERYTENNIEYQQIKGEDIHEQGWDEVWIYNTLGHVVNPEIVVKNAKKAGVTIRIFEYIDTIPDAMHLHVLTREKLDEWLGHNTEIDDSCKAGHYYAIVNNNLSLIKYGEPDQQGFIPKYQPSGLTFRQKRFHLPGLPHIATNKKEALACAFSQKVIKMAQMLKRLGHTVYFYGIEGSEVECDEYIQVSTQAILREAYGDYDKSKETYRHGVDNIATRTFNENCIMEIRKRMQSNDFLLIPFSPAMYRQLIDTLYNKYVNIGDGLYLIVEMGIGYRGTYCPFRVWESSSQMHFQYGLESAHDGGGSKNGGSYDVVIPNYFDPDDFTYSEDKEDYFLYLGRIITRKGVSTAVQTTQKIGARLIVAGQKAGAKIDLSSPHVEDFGFANLEDRRRLLSRAKGVFLPTWYIEPFGGVCIEAALSGTPVITSDWGAFVELVLHGKTGYRCRTLDHYVWAARNIEIIKPIDCYNYAMANFTLDRVMLMYEEYFDMLLDVKENKDINGIGWSRIHPERTNLDWLIRDR